MSGGRDSPVSAMVLLSTAGGRPRDEEVTAANVERLRPREGVDANAREHFARAGFDVGPTVGGAFSITARPDLFERHFRLALNHSERGWRAPGGSDELPLAALPNEVAGSIRVIGLEAPPDFGPGARG